MVNRLPDYRLVEDYQNSSLAREAAERKKARTARATKAWSKKYGADYAKRKGKNKVVTKTITAAQAAAQKSSVKWDTAVNRDITMGSQNITAKGTKGLSGAGVSKSSTISPKVKNIVKPVYTGIPGKSQTFMGTTVTNPQTGVSKFTPKGQALKGALMKQGPKVVKNIAKGATRAIPGIGAALLVKDVYDVNKWAASQPKKKKKGVNIYGTVSKNNIYKGY